MKKTLVYLFALILFPVSFAIAQQPYQLKYPYKYAEKQLNAGLKLTPKFRENIVNEYFYTAKIHYPLLQSENAQQAKVFNDKIEKTLTTIVNGFKNDLARPKDLLKLQSQDAPLSAGSNSLDVNYDAFYVKNKDILSIRFLVSVFYYRSAHPLSYFFTLNYDLNNQQFLKLADLLPEHYLSILQSIVRPVLIKDITRVNGQRLSPFQLKAIQDGTQAKPINYRNWNLTPNGLLINFDPYQVGAYALGPRYVLINYAKLKSIGFKLPETTKK
ncbi:MAG: RsiV family protein [Pseudomonadota bacterium]